MKKRSLIIVGTVIFLCSVLLFGFGSYSQIKHSNSNNSMTDNFKNRIDYSSSISEELVYCSSFLSPSSDIDLSDINDIYENCDLVVTGIITEKNSGIVAEGQDYVISLGSIEIEEIIKGDFSETTIDFYINGGYCTLKEYEDALALTRPELLSKLGICELSQEYKNSNYITFIYEYGKDFKIGNRYVIMLEKNNYGYCVLSNYGFLDLTDEIKIRNKQDIINILK